MTNTRRAALAAAALLAAAPVAGAVPPEWSRTATQALPAAGEFTVEDVAAGNGFAATAGLGADTPTGRVPAVIERSGTGPTWGAPVRLGPAGRVDFGPLVARNGRGDAVAVWGAVGGRLNAAVRFGGSWSAPVDTGGKVPGLRNGNADDAIKVAIGADRRARIGILSCGGGGCSLQVLATGPRPGNGPSSVPSAPRAAVPRAPAGRWDPAGTRSSRGARARR